MKEHRFVVCINNKGYEASLEFGKIYQVVIDEEQFTAAAAGAAWLLGAVVRAQTSGLNSGSRR